jgi:hypothetical protein
MNSQNSTEWASLSNQSRDVPKCKACMTIRRRTKERGYGPVYCADCGDTVASSRVKIVTDGKPTRGYPDGKPLFIETVYPGVQQLRPCKKCGEPTPNYNFCHKVRGENPPCGGVIDSEMDDFIYMDIE